MRNPGCHSFPVTQQTDADAGRLASSHCSPNCLVHGGIVLATEGIPAGGTAGRSTWGDACTGFQAAEDSTAGWPAVKKTCLSLGKRLLGGCGRYRGCQAGSNAAARRV